MSVIVLKPAASARLTTVANARMDLGLSEAKFPDGRVERLIDTASAMAARFCNRAFGRQIYRERLDFDRNASWMEIVLSEGPVTSIISVGQGTTVLDPALYEHDDLRLYRVEAGHRCCWCGRGLVVDYQAGWLLPGEAAGTDFAAAPALPTDLEKAVIQLVGVAASEATRDPTVKAETVEGVGSTQYYVQGAAASLPHPGAEATLQAYRNMVLV